MDRKLLGMVSVIFHHPLLLMSESQVSCQYIFQLIDCQILVYIILADVRLIPAHSGFIRDFRPFSHHDPSFPGKHDTPDIVITIQNIITIIFQKKFCHIVKGIHGIPQKFCSLRYIKNRAEPALVGPAKSLLIVLFFPDQLQVGGIAAAIQRHDRDNKTDSVRSGGSPESSGEKNLSR